MRRKRLVGVTLGEVAHWVGRDELVGKLRGKLRGAAAVSLPKVMALVGQGGIGKTGLAAKLMAAVGVDLARGELVPECPYDGVICLRVAEGTGFDELAGELLAAVGPGSRDLVRTEDKLRAIWAGLRREAWLVVLDNLEDILHPPGHGQAGRALSPELGQLLNGLVYQPHGSQVILTSRERLRDLADGRGFGGEPDPGLVWVESVEGVGTAAGVDLLRQLGLRDSEADLRWVVERVAGHVLVLRLLASLAVGKPGYLRKHPQLVRREAGPILRAQLARLDGAGLELLKRMCVLRVGVDVQGLTFLRLYTQDWDEDDRFVMAAAMEEPAELTEAEIGETQELVERLVGCSLVQSRYDERACEDFYDLHRLVVEFLQAEFAAELPELLQRVYSFYCTGKTVENPKTLADLQPLLEAQHFAFQLGNYGEAENLIYQLERYLEPWGHWTLLKDLCEQIVDRLDDDSRPYILSRIGSRYRDWGNWDQAEQYFRQALKLAQRNDDKSMIAGATGQLGDIERKRGNWDAAERLFRQCLELRQELGDRSGMVVSIGCLGENELGRGNLDAAETLLKDALQQMETLGMTWHIAETNWDLAQLERQRGSHPQAQQHYAVAHQLFTQLGAKKDLEKIDREWTQPEA